MLELMIIVLFIWLFCKALKLPFKVAWGATKIAASLLFAIAVPLLVLCLVFAGGLLLLIPVGLIALALGLLKACT